MHYDLPKQNQDNLLFSYDAEHVLPWFGQLQLSEDNTKKETSQAHLRVRYKSKFKTKIK